MGQRQRADALSSWRGQRPSWAEREEWRFHGRSWSEQRHRGASRRGRPLLFPDELARPCTGGWRRLTAPITTIRAWARLPASWAERTRLGTPARFYGRSGMERSPHQNRLVQSGGLPGARWHVRSSQTESAPCRERFLILPVGPSGAGGPAGASARVPTTHGRRGGQGSLPGRNPGMLRLINAPDVSLHMLFRLPDRLTLPSSISATPGKTLSVSPLSWSEQRGVLSRAAPRRRLAAAHA